MNFGKNTKQKRNTLSEDELISEEGKIFLRYVTGKEPSSTLINRYKDVIKKLEKGVSLSLPKHVVYFPFLIQIYEKNLLSFKNKSSVLNRRLGFAFMIAEASTENVDKFFLLKKKGKVSTLLRLSFIVFGELLTSFLGFFLRIPFALITNKRFKDSI